ncbi:MAG: hypothetical protein ACHQ52_08975 [Candidatus Eisenbacteria bacterium]
MVRERRENPQAPRRRFSALAREAIEAVVPETRDRRAHWHVSVNRTSVCWPARDSWRHVALEREHGTVSGEYGQSDASADLEELASMPDDIHGTPIGLRVALERLLEEPLSPWRAGGEEPLRERLVWIVTQLVALGPPWLERHAVTR